MKERNLTIVTLEYAGVIEGEKALEILAHVEAVWERGQQVVRLLRQELPAEKIDVIAPLRNGGVHLHKLFGVMHDTCHAANKAPPLPLRVCPVPPPNLNPTIMITMLKNRWQV
jgi:hypothetical protein